MNPVSHNLPRLVDWIEASPQSLRLPCGREVFLERAKGREHDNHFVTFMRAAVDGNGAHAVGELLALSQDVGQLLALDTFGDAECYSLTLNGARTGSWNDTAHVNLYLFESRAAKLRSYKAAVDAAMEEGR